MICLHKCITEIYRPRPLALYFTWGFGTVQRLLFLLNFGMRQKMYFKKLMETFIFTSICLFWKFTFGQTPGCKTEDRGQNLITIMFDWVILKDLMLFQILINLVSEDKSARRMHQLLNFPVLSSQVDSFWTVIILRFRKLSMKKGGNGGYFWENYFREKESI